MPLIIRRTTVDKEDIPRLDEGQCLNDNLIGYGLRYLFDVFDKRAKDLDKRVYFHNSFFYEKLKAGRGAINYDGVKNWTAKVDLLSYDYIVVPVNEHYHWWVAIICNPGKLDPDSRALPGKSQGPTDEAEGNIVRTATDVEMTDVTETRLLQSPTGPAAADIVNLVSDDKDVSVDLTSASRTKQTKKSKSGARTYNLEDPRIITLDSLGSNHPQGINLLKKYLLAEFEHKRNKVITDLPQQLGMRATQIPEQDNLCDCGVYLLGYIQQFVRNPDEFVEIQLKRQSPDWKFDPSDLRELWRETILKEHKEEQLKAKEKRESSAAKRTPKGSAEPSRDPSREAGEVSNASNSKRGTVMASSEEPASRKTSGAPANPGVCEGGGSSTKPAPRSSPSNVSQQRQSSVTVPARSPQRPPRQDSPDEVVVVLPAQEDGDVLPSVEAADVEELHNPPPPPPKDPKFLHQLSSSSTSESSDDEDIPKEVTPKAFYAPHGAMSTTKPKTAAPSSSSRVRRRRAAKAKAAPKHTDLRFAPRDSLGQDLEPVVENAEMVRPSEPQSEPIDLT
jgi:sentrin-specific protease 7